MCTILSSFEFILWFVLHEIMWFCKQEYYCSIYDEFLDQYHSNPSRGVCLHTTYPLQIPITYQSINR